MWSFLKRMESIWTVLISFYYISAFSFKISLPKLRATVKREARGRYSTLFNNKLYTRWPSEDFK